MQIRSIKIHNFRSIKDAKKDFYNYSILVGANNSGKTNFLTALRIFYEDNITFNDKIDFPKFETDDNESWIDVEYTLIDDEFKNLKKDYQNPNNILKVRKYLKSDDKDKVKSKQSNIYAYENGEISENLFYGAKNIAQTKLGSVLYIPEVTKIDETLKLTGPSPLRNIITFVMKRVIKNSESFNNLNRAFEDFNIKFEVEASKDGFSLNKLKEEINRDLKEWNVEFDFNINPIKPEQMIKNLVSHYAIDQYLKKEIEIKNFGQGLQRHLIYILLKISSQYLEKKVYKKKEFSPDLNLILFEEPEAFLHPSQQEYLNNGLKTLSSEQGTQIIISTHSPFFISKNIEDISTLIKLKRENGISQVFQVLEDTKMTILSENNELAQMFYHKLDDPTINPALIKNIERKLGITDNLKRMEEEAMRYLLWLDSERCCSFFADIVLICEGASEKVLIDYLLKNKWHDLMEQKIYVLDVLGKYNIHRYMNLFKELGIYHSVLADKDEDESIHGLINEFIIDQQNAYTRSIDFFDKDIETFLKIESPPKNRRDKKPLNIMWNYFKGNISPDRIEGLKKKIENLILVN